MRLPLKLLIILTVCLVDPASTVRSLVYQKEMSEYCRRRVMPSVFLGTHVAEAHSRILHFSKMELPYSCFISVRGELGSNLILVAQLLSDSNLVSACDYYPNQVLVYEMGETFGGYWGPLPETLMRPTPTVQRRYVHKSTTIMSTQKTLVGSTEKPTTATTETPMATEPKQDYIQVEVPLLELTGQMESGGNESPVFKIEDSFDSLFDVTPGAHEQYVTNELPMLQFSIGKSVDGRRFGTDTDTMFDFEYEDGLPTSDVKLPYLSLRTTTKKKSSIRKTYDTIRSYTKQKPLFTVTRKPKTDNKLRLDNKKTNHTTEKTWEQIEELLKGLNESNLRNAEAVDESENITKILESISKLNHNYSLYLHPDWKSIENIEKFQRNTLNKYNFSLFTRKLFPHLTLATQNIHQLLKSTMFFNFTNNFSTKSTNFYDKNVTVNVTQVTTEHSKKMVEDNFTQSISYDNNNLNETTYTEQSSMIYNVTMSSVSTQVQSEETTNYKTHDVSTKTSTVTPVPGTMVDHESWENVVQAAPVMAVLLNSTAQTDIAANSISPENFTTAMRKKRRILPISIEDARPHELITSREVTTTESQVYYPSDVQDFAQLVELQDDELHDRVALRYLRQYVGPILFNICDYTEPKARQIFLFNSSRIVIAISNFTLERMSVVLTPARTLVGSSAKCSDCRLECQVFGTRVCIDKINACDGVPNCGAFDIYDEDRLTCGAAVGLQHNVYLAAITFIAVLLTMLYTVHYWLRRCVPKVSEAFFIYTDRAENTLYLETIMRSPHDAEDNTNLYHHGSVFMTEETIYDELVSLNKVKRRIGYKMWRCCFAFITCKCRRKVDHDLKLDLGPNKGTTKTTYSFTELELKKMGTLGGVDVCVQTGDSLEIGNKNKNTPTKEQQPHHIIEMQSISSDTDSRKQSKELQILKLLKESKSHCKESCKCTGSPDEASIEEKVICMHDLHSSATYTDIQMPKPKEKPEVYSPTPKSSKTAVKHLRFDEEPVTIPTSDFEDEEELMQGLPVDGDRTHKKDHNSGKTEDELGTSREARRFWHTKTKKSRKKTNLALH